MTAPVLSPASKALLPWLVAVAFFMESLDTTILNTAVPTISAALHAAPLSMKSVLASYTLSLAVFIPISGWMADRFGTRRVFASAIGLFTLGSFLCGLSSDIPLLVTCRVLQGCGGAMMVPVGRLTLVRSFARSELVRAMSFVAVPALVGPMLGPLVGGLIVGYLQWRFIFFVNLPIGIAGLVMVYLHLPDYREKKTHPLDIVGLILFGSGVALLSYVLEIFGDHSLGTREILGLLALSFVLIGGYGVHASRIKYPLLQLGLFRIRTFRAAVSGSFITRLGMGGVPFLLPLLYQVGLGFTPIQSGLLDHAAGLGGAQHQARDAEYPDPFRLPHHPDLEHRLHRPLAAGIFDYRAADARGIDRAAGVLLRSLRLAAIYQHEHARVCRRRRETDERRQLHRQHHAADVGELRRRCGRPDDGGVHSRPLASQPGRHDPRPASGLYRARDILPILSTPRVQPVGNAATAGMSSPAKGRSPRVSGGFDALQFRRKPRSSRRRLKAVYNVPGSTVQGAFQDDRRQSDGDAADGRCKFTAWDGYIWGKTLERVPGKRIVQSVARTTNFTGLWTRILKITVTLKAIDGGTKLTLRHSNVPKTHKGYENGGWQTHYFAPMQKYFSKPSLSGKRIDVVIIKIVDIAEMSRKRHARPICYGRSRQQHFSAREIK